MPVLLLADAMSYLRINEWLPVKQVSKDFRAAATKIETKVHPGTVHLTMNLRFDQSGRFETYRRVIRESAMTASSVRLSVYGYEGRLRYGDGGDAFIAYYESEGLLADSAALAAYERLLLLYAFRRTVAVRIDNTGPVRDKAWGSTDPSERMDLLEWRSQYFRMARVIVLNGLTFNSPRANLRKLAISVDARALSDDDRIARSLAKIGEHAPNLSMFAFEFPASLPEPIVQLVLPPACKFVVFYVNVSSETRALQTAMTMMSTRGTEFPDGFIKPGRQVRIVYQVENGEEYGTSMYGGLLDEFHFTHPPSSGRLRDVNVALFCSARGYTVRGTSPLDLFTLKRSTELAFTHAAGRPVTGAFQSFPEHVWFKRPLWVDDSNKDASLEFVTEAKRAEVQFCHTFEEIAAMWTRLEVKEWEAENDDTKPSTSVFVVPRHQGDPNVGLMPRVILPDGLALAFYDYGTNIIANPPNPDGPYKITITLRQAEEEIKLLSLRRRFGPDLLTGRTDILSPGLTGPELKSGLWSVVMDALTGRDAEHYIETFGQAISHATVHGMHNYMLDYLAYRAPTLDEHGFFVGEREGFKRKLWFIYRGAFPHDANEENLYKDAIPEEQLEFDTTLTRCWTDPADALIRIDREDDQCLVAFRPLGSTRAFLSLASGPEWFIGPQRFRIVHQTEEEWPAKWSTGPAHEWDRYLRRRCYNPITGEQNNSDPIDVTAALHLGANPAPRESYKSKQPPEEYVFAPVVMDSFIARSVGNTQTLAEMELKPSRALVKEAAEDAAAERRREAASALAIGAFSSSSWSSLSASSAPPIFGVPTPVSPLVRLTDGVTVSLSLSDLSVSSPVGGYTSSLLSSTASSSTTSSTPVSWLPPVSFPGAGTSSSLASLAARTSVPPRRNASAAGSTDGGGGRDGSAAARRRPLQVIDLTRHTAPVIDLTDSDGSYATPIEIDDISGQLGTLSLGDRERMRWRRGASVR